MAGGDGDGALNDDDGRTSSARPPPPPLPSVSVAYRDLPPASLAWLREALSAWQAHHVRYFGAGEAAAGFPGPLSSGSLELLLRLAPPRQQQARLLPVFADVPLSSTSGGSGEDEEKEAEGEEQPLRSRPATLRLSPAASRLASRRFNERYERAAGGAVPRFDRAVPASALSSSRSSSACFNCSSPAHALRDCPHARDHAAIAAARSAFAERQAAATAAAGVGGGTAAARYFEEQLPVEGKGAAAAQTTVTAPGKLSEETRLALGIGPGDPPPWLRRMRQLGYPRAWIKKRAKKRSSSDDGDDGGAKRRKLQKREAPLELPPELEAITRDRPGEEEEAEDEEEEEEEEENDDDEAEEEEEPRRLVEFEGFGESDDDNGGGGRIGSFRGAGQPSEGGAEERQRRAVFAAAAAAAAAAAHLAAAAQRQRSSSKRPRSDGGDGDGDGDGGTAACREENDFGYSDLGDDRGPARTAANDGDDDDDKEAGEIEDGEL